MNSLANANTIVVGASRGFGRAIGTRLAADSASVVAIARDADALTELANGAGSITPHAANAVDPELPTTIYEAYAHRPSFWSPAQSRRSRRCTSRRGSRSQSTGRPTST